MFAGNDSVSSASNLTSVLVKLNEQAPAILKFLQAFSGLVAIIILGWSLYSFVKMSRRDSDAIKPATAVLGVIIAGMLLQLGPSIDVFLNSIYGNASVSNLMSYKPHNASPMTVEGVKAVIGLVRLYGYYSFISGMIGLRNLFENSGDKSERFKKNAWHVVGGILCINIVQTVNILTSSAGFGDVLS